MREIKPDETHPADGGEQVGVGDCELLAHQVLLVAELLGNPGVAIGQALFLPDFEFVIGDRVEQR